MIGLPDLQRQIALAMLAQGALAIVLLFLLPIPRIAAMRAGTVKRDDSGRPAFPKWATQVADCFANQFQAPVLFYMVCLLALWLRAETQWLVWLAWGFVGFRWAHAAVFVTSNFVPLRFGMFLASALLLSMMLLNVGRFVWGH